MKSRLFTKAHQLPACYWKGLAEEEGFELPGSLLLFWHAPPHPESIVVIAVLLLLHGH